MVKITTNQHLNTPSTNLINIPIMASVERKKGDHGGCFQGTLFVQGTTKPKVTKPCMCQDY